MEALLNLVDAPAGSPQTNIPVKPFTDSLSASGDSGRFPSDL